MSEPFGLYSRYYDLLYRDKDYAEETSYVRSLLSRFHPDAQSLLELGCGTGKHACLLAEAGFDITGVERSDQMIAEATKRASQVATTTDANSGQMTIRHGDARSVRLNQRFDAVLSLFHVVSYQSTNEDILAMFETASLHLNQNGLFLFDVWYGPAVLTLSPTARVKRMEDDQTSVLRIAEPTIDFNRNLVDVHYTVLITDKTTGLASELTESHRMRYLFTPELELLAEATGMCVEHSEQWLDGAKPSEQTWGVTFVARKVRR